MISQAQSIPQNPVNMADEEILVVKRSTLFGKIEWQGLHTEDFDSFLSLIHTEQEFHPRSLMEADPRYKQIIPYLIFKHDNRYFIMQRKSESSEQRLKNKYSLGIGGHINKEDVTGVDILAWSRREFHEEISFNGEFTVKVIGLLNDDSNPVGEVHLGCVLLLEGNSSEISIKSELKSGELLTLEECEYYYPQMENWSQIAYKHLKSS